MQMKKRLVVVFLLFFAVVFIIMLLNTSSDLVTSPLAALYDPVAHFRSQGKRKGIDGRPAWTTDQKGHNSQGDASRLFFTHDDWPQFLKSPYNFTLPKSPFDPPYTIQWDFDTSAFLQQPDVRGKPPKLITWAAPVRYLPSIPDPVRLRVCPEMPCRITTNGKYRSESAALIWNAQTIEKKSLPHRASPDQVFVFHNQERLDPGLLSTYSSTFYRPEWRSAFNWTMSFRTDSDIFAPYGFLAERPSTPAKDYQAIVAQKDKMAAWLVSHCNTHGRREDFVKLLQKHVSVDVYGRCGPFKCARDKDQECFEKLTKKYKFYLSLENSVCQDYFTEKMFRYLDADVVLVVRGGQGYENQIPAGGYINANDFKSIKELADYLQFLDQNPEEYIKILRSKDRYQVMYEEYPHRDKNGRVTFMHYHYEAVPICEMCRRLWDLDPYRKVVPNLREWFELGKCTSPQDLH